MKGIRIAVDAAGGDLGGRNVIAGALSAARHLGFGLTLVGPDPFVRDELRRQENIVTEGVDIRVVSASEVIAMDEGPTALRRKPNASVKVAAELVANGEAAAFFSAGNTGATLIAAHSVFGMMPGVDRPALATTIPTRHRDAVLLDVGATIDCRPRHLLQFAAMGTVYAERVLGIANPRVGLLSIGEEAIKGNELTRDAHCLLSSSDIRFIGNLEARDLYSGDADVVVCDGFTGNVALKTAEGTANFITSELKKALSSNILGKISSFLNLKNIKKFKNKLDPRLYNGAILLGLDAPVIKSHGGTDYIGFANSLLVCEKIIRGKLIEKIKDNIN